DATFGGTRGQPGHSPINGQGVLVTQSLNFNNVPKTSPTLITNASESAGGVVGTAVLSDSATLSGSNSATGTITFTLTQPDSTTITVGTVSVNGDGTYNAPTILATEVGTYTWHASYSGDSFNNGAIDNGANESVTTVKASPTLVTTASFSAGNVVGSAIPQ